MKKEDPTFLNSGQGHYRPTEQLSGVGWEVISGSVIFVNKTVSRMDLLIKQYPEWILLSLLLPHIFILFQNEFPRYLTMEGFSVYKLTDLRVV